MTMQYTLYIRYSKAAISGKKVQRRTALHNVVVKLGKAFWSRELIRGVGGKERVHKKGWKQPRYDKEREKVGGHSQSKVLSRSHIRLINDNRFYHGFGYRHGFSAKRPVPNLEGIHNRPKITIVRHN